MTGPADRIVALERIRAARTAIAGHVGRTPILSSRTAGRVVAAATGRTVRDGRIHLKAEHLQTTGSFKVRATSSRVAALAAADRAAGIITASAGNAGQAYAWAAREWGVPATVVVPVGANPSKVDACRGYGARVIHHGAHFGEAAAEMARIAEAEGLVVCHPYDDPDVIAGNGSVGLELLEDLPELDLVVVAIGGGGLISGTAAALKELRPSVRVVGVEPETADAMARALEAGRPVTIEPRSVADGLGSAQAGSWTLPMCTRYVDEVVRIPDDEILGGVRFGLERLKQVLEPAGAAALAALLYGRVRVREGEQVVAVLSGGNVDLGRLGELISGVAPLPAT